MPPFLNPLSAIDPYLVETSQEDVQTSSDLRGSTEIPPIDNDTSKGVLGGTSSGGSNAILASVSTGGSRCTLTDLSGTCNKPTVPLKRKASSTLQSPPTTAAATSNPISSSSKPFTSRKRPNIRADNPVSGQTSTAGHPKPSNPKTSRGIQEDDLTEILKNAINFINTSTDSKVKGLRSFLVHVPSEPSMLLPDRTEAKNDYNGRFAREGSKDLPVRPRVYKDVPQPGIPTKNLSDVVTQDSAGHVPGNPVGTIYHDRLTVMKCGLHSSNQAGIDCAKAKMNKTPTLASPAIVFDRKTAGNKDFGDIIWYTGQGNDVVSQCAVLENKNNRALANACAAGARNGGACAGDAWRRGSPVRVLKSINKNYVYCGLFKVSRYWIQPLRNPAKDDVPALIFELRRDHWLEATLSPPEATNVKIQDFDPIKRELPNQSTDDVVSFKNLAADDPLRLQMKYKNVIPQRVFTDVEVHNLSAQESVVNGTSVGTSVGQTEAPQQHVQQGGASSATVQVSINNGVLAAINPVQGKIENKRQIASRHDTQPSHPQKSESAVVASHVTVNNGMYTATADSHTEISEQHQDRGTFQQEMQHGYPQQIGAPAAMSWVPVINSMFDTVSAGQSEIPKQHQYQGITRHELGQQFDAAATMSQDPVNNSMLNTAYADQSEMPKQNEL